MLFTACCWAIVRCVQELCHQCCIRPTSCCALSFCIAFAGLGHKLLNNLVAHAGTHHQVREAYERAIANVPPALEKRFWQRYIYLWVNYALWEELDARDSERTREVYRACLQLLPHKTFTFGKARPACIAVDLLWESILGPSLRFLLGWLCRIMAVMQLVPHALPTVRGPLPCF